MLEDGFVVTLFVCLVTRLVVDAQNASFSDVCRLFVLLRRIIHCGPTLCYKMHNPGGNLYNRNPSVEFRDSKRRRSFLTMSKNQQRGQPLPHAPPTKSFNVKALGSKKNTPKSTKIGGGCEKFCTRGDR